MEITHHINILSNAKKSVVKCASKADMHTVAFIKEHIPDIRHIFIETGYWDL